MEVLVDWNPKIFKHKGRKSKADIKEKVNQIGQR